MYFALAFFKSSSDTKSVLIFLNSLKISTTALSVTAFLTEAVEENLEIYLLAPKLEYEPYVQPFFSLKFYNKRPSPPPPRIWLAKIAAK